MPFQRKTQQQIEAMNAGELRAYKATMEDVFEVLRDKVYDNGGLDQISVADRADWFAMVEEISAVTRRIVHVVLGMAN